MNMNEKMELSYYGLSLLQYLKESHPDKVKDLAFIQSRAEAAAEIYEQALLDGYVAPQAEEMANDALFSGLHFSKYDTIVTILWNEFIDEVPQGDAFSFAEKVLPFMEEVFHKYTLSDDFAYTSEYQMLYTELTGSILMYIEEYGV